MENKSNIKEKVFSLLSIVFAVLTFLSSLSESFCAILNFSPYLPIGFGVLGIVFGWLGVKGKLRMTFIGLNVLVLVYYLIILFVMTFSIAPCSSDEVPEFVQKSDFETIDWERIAVEFGENQMIGNVNKSGVIGTNLPSLKGQIWKFYLWDVEKPTSTELTVVGYHKETETVHQILEYDWSIELSKGEYAADAKATTSVIVSEAGEWAMLLYTDEELFDVLVYEIDE